MDSKFTRKARLVAGGHKTATPSSMTYSIVVNRQSVMLKFFIYGMNYLDICDFYIGNAFLNAPYQGKLCNEAGSEFGSEKLYVLLFLRALYGLNSSGAAWRYKLAETLN